MHNKRVLVTGGAGFIGSNLANYLGENNDVIALDDEFLGTRENVENAEFVEASVLEDDLPTDVDVVVHLAARSSRAMLEDDPLGGTRVNVDGFVNVVEQALADGCDTILYASTSSMYDDDLPSSEDEAVTAATGYEASMLSRERYAEYYAEYYDDISIAGLRFFSVYQGYGGAEEHKGEYANTVSQFAAQIAAGERPVLWADGEQTRDFTHVSDVVRAVERVADERLTGVYNVGTGRKHTFNEVVSLVNDALGTDVDPRYEEIPIENYNYAQRADPSKLRDATGWEPEIEFEAGVEMVCEPYRNG